MKQHITIGEQIVRLEERPLGDYLCLTDLAKLVDADTSRVIGKWMELLRTLEFLYTWETHYNPHFEVEGYTTLRLRAGVPNFFLSPRQWIERTKAIGIEMRLGRTGGTFAHHLIALEFCSTMDAHFRFKVFQEYTALRQNRAVSWLQVHQFFLQKIEDNALENNRLAIQMQQDLKLLERDASLTHPKK